MSAARFVNVAASLLICTLILVGCGLFGDDAADVQESSVSVSEAAGTLQQTAAASPRSSTFAATSTTESTGPAFSLSPSIGSAAAGFPLDFVGPLAASAAYGLYITDIIPNLGSTAGGTQVAIVGSFPVSATISTIAAAEAAYTVYFDYFPAVFDPAFLPNIVTSSVMHVITPAHAAGFVDVLAQDDINPVNFANVVNGYRYVDPSAPLTIFDIIPNSGPVVGGNPAMVLGSFGIYQTIDNVLEATGAYVIEFIDVDDMVSSVAVFDPSVVNIVTLAEMNIIVPPSPSGAPGFVDVRVTDRNNPEFTFTLANAYFYFGPITVAPNCGPLSGGTRVRITGSFPVAAAIYDLYTADSFYQVFFGAVPANFDASVTPVVTDTDMFVIAPPGIAPGPVDVWVFDEQGGVLQHVLGFEPDGFNYVPDVVIDGTIPVTPPPILGPLSGGTPVTLTGTFLQGGPDITTLMAAEAAYKVYFGVYTIYTNLATFDTTIQPIITGFDMDVISSPGIAPGLVDIWVFDCNCIQNFDRLPASFDYEGGIGIWSGVEIVTKDRSATIRPNDPVGPVDAGELEVRLTITGAISEAFIVPQGGDPAIVAHRIALAFDIDRTADLLAVDPADPRVVWTNVLPIRVDMLGNDDGVPDQGELFVDGHAAVYLIDDQFTLIGDDLIDLTDGGIIQFDAFSDRHFLIDTISPVMDVVDGTNFADNFVELRSNANPVGYTPTAVPPLGGTLGPTLGIFPFPFPGGGFTQTNNDSPVDAGKISDVPGSPNGASIFMNVVSLSNEFDVEDWDITVGVLDNGFPGIIQGIRFIDQDIHTAFGLIPNLTADEDRFDPGNTFRQPSGFALTPNPTLVIGSVRDVPLRGDNVQWLLDPSSDRPPLDRVNTVNAAYEVDLSILLSGYVAAIPPTAEGMFVTWEVNDVLPLADMRDKFHLVLKFRGHDTAGSWLTTASSPDTKTNFTDPERLLGPLHIWWLRDTSTRITPNREGQEVFNPSFQLILDKGFVTGAVNLNPLFNYRVFANNRLGKDGYDIDIAAFPAESYDAPLALNDWTGWLDVNSISGIFDIADLRNRWVLLVAVDVDEAGNLEQWPTDELDLDDGGTPGVFTDDSVIQFLASSGRNWQRFFLLAEEQFVETDIVARFWHNKTAFDDVVDAGETDFGDQTIIPLPPKSTFDPLDPVAPVETERVEAEFTITTTATAEVGETIRVFWEIEENGTVLDSGTLGPFDSGSDTRTLVLPFNGNVFFRLGDPERRLPRNYIFRAFTFVDANGNNSVDGGESRDSSPANVSFVVVPSVQGFIENRESSDEQPVKVFERQ